MGSPNSNVSRENFDAAKGYTEVTLQQGVPITDADWNEAQRAARWMVERSRDAFLAFDTSQVTVPAGLYDLVQIVDPSKTWPADAPSVADTLESWYPGSMRPWIASGDSKTNDFNIQWGPCWIQGLFVEDFDQRGPAALYSDTTHVITTGEVTSVVSETVTDDSKVFVGLVGSLHLALSAAAPVANGQAARCTVTFTSGIESGQTYEIASVTANSFTIVGTWNVGTPSATDTYYISPNAIDFVNGDTYNVWLCAMVEDIDTVEDADVEDPTMLIETSHKLKIRYWMRVLRDGPNTPTTASRPDYGDAAPQLHKNRVYWEKVATITTDADDTLDDPADIVFNTPGHYEIGSLAEGQYQLARTLEGAGFRQRLRMGVEWGTSGFERDHRFLLEGVQSDEGSSQPFSYLLDLATPTGSSGGFAGLRIGGPENSGADIWSDFLGDTMGNNALHIVDGGMAIGPVAAPLFSYSALSERLDVQGDVFMNTVGSSADTDLQLSLVTQANDAFRLTYANEFDDPTRQKFFDLDFGPGDSSAIHRSDFDFRGNAGGTAQARMRFDRAAASARGLLTFTANPLDTETVTINGKVYTFQVTLTDVDGNVLIGATAAESLDNLQKAIDLDAPNDGSIYAASMTDPGDIAAVNGPGDTMEVTASAAGSAGNAITTTTTVTGGSWTDATLVFGADQGDGIQELLIEDGNFHMVDLVNVQDFVLFDVDSGDVIFRNPGTGNVSMQLEAGGDYYVDVQDADSSGFRVLNAGNTMFQVTQGGIYLLADAAAAPHMSIGGAAPYIDLTPGAATEIQVRNGDLRMTTGNLIADNVVMDNPSPGTERNVSFSGFDMIGAAYAQDQDMALGDQGTIGNGPATGSKTVYLPLPDLPEGVMLNEMRVISSTAGGGSAQVRVRLQRAAISTAITPTWTTLFEVSDTAADGAYHDNTDTTGGEAYTPDSRYYRLEVFIDNDGAILQALLRQIVINYLSNKLYDDGLDF